jgi:hypothetical protein
LFTLGDHTPDLQAFDAADRPHKQKQSDNDEKDGFFHAYPIHFFGLTGAMDRRRKARLNDSSKATRYNCHQKPKSQCELMRTHATWRVCSKFSPGDIDDR